MEPTGRPCEVCGKSDEDCFVVSSAWVAMSNNVCKICMAMDAEVTQYGKNATYNSNDDKYYDASDNHILIQTKSGKTFDTRAEYLKYVK